MWSRGIKAANEEKELSWSTARYTENETWTNLPNELSYYMGWYLDVVDCGLTYVTFSDISAIQWRDNFPFPNLNLLPGTQRHGHAMGLKRAEPTLTRAKCRQNTSLTYLSSDDQQAVIKVSRESNPDHSIHSPARYLYTTVASQNIARHITYILVVHKYYSNRTIASVTRFTKGQEH